MTIDGGRVVVRLEGKDVSLSRIIQQVERDLRSAASSINQFNTALHTNRSSQDQAATSAQHYDEALARTQTTTERNNQSSLQYAQALAKLQAQSGDLAGAIRTLETAGEKLNATDRQSLGLKAKVISLYQRQQREALKLAQAQARLASRQGNNTGAQDILLKNINAIGASSKETIGAQLQLIGVQEKLANESANAATAQGKLKPALDENSSAADKLRNSVNNLQGVLGAVGIGLGVAEIVRFGGEMINAANSLERTQVTIKAVAGSQERYNEVMQIALANQKLFGGSLEENLGPLQQFLFISNRTGASLESLNDVAQLLATVNPLEGIEGAGFALSEAFSGDLTSIVERFNLPRAAIRELLNEAEGADEVLAGVTDILAQQGVTAEVLAASLDTNAQTYNELGAAGDRLKTSLGSLLSDAFLPVAQGAADMAAGIAGAIDQINQAEQARSAVSSQILVGAENYEQYAQRVITAQQLATDAIDSANPAARLIMQWANAGQVGAYIQALTQGQYELAAALQTAGVSATDAQAQVSGLSDAQVRYAQALMATGVGITAAVSQANQYGEAINAVRDAQGALWDDTSISSAALNQLSSDMQFLIGTTDENRAAVLDLVGSYEAGTTSATDLYTQIAALYDAYDLATYGTDANTVATDNNSAALAFNANATNQNAADTLTQEMQSYAAAEAQRELEAALQSAANSSASAGDLAVQLAHELGIEEQAVYELIQYYRELNAERGAGGGALGNLTKIKGAGSSFTRWKIDNEIGKYAPRATGGRGGGGGGSAKKGKTDAEKEAEKRLEQEEKLREDLLDIQADYAEKLEDAEKDHVEKLEDIYNDYYEKQKQAAEENELDKRRGRYDFYAGLGPDDTEGIDAQQFAAQYEAAFAEAQRLAQEGKAALSKEFLDLRTEQINEMMELEKEMAAVANDKDLNEQERQAQLEYLAGLKALLEEAQKAELDQLMSGGDSNLNELNERLTEEEARYAEQTSKIAEEAGKQADAKVLAAEKAREGILSENEALQAQYDLLRDITALTGAQVPLQPSVAPTLPTQSVTAPIPVEDANANVMYDANGVIVKQFELWQTHDSIVNTTLQTVGGRLEQQLAEIKAAIATSSDAITRGLALVDSSLNRLGSQVVTK